MALLFGGPVRLGGFVVRETGRRGSSSTGAPCSEVGADVSGNRNGGGGFMVRATLAWSRFIVSGNWGSELAS